MEKYKWNCKPIIALLLCVVGIFFYKKNAHVHTHMKENEQHCKCLFIFFLPKGGMKERVFYNAA